MGGLVVQVMEGISRGEKGCVEAQLGEKEGSMDGWGEGGDQAGVWL